MVKQQPALADFAAEKARLRKDLAGPTLPPGLVREESLRILTRLIQLPEFEAAKRVGLYLALAGEPDTESLVSACRDRGKTLCVPTYVAGEGQYAMARLDEETRLARGHFGVMEPVDPTWFDAHTMDLVVVPGVAFDTRGNRLGHGKGYYDRLLNGLPAIRAGLALSSQMVDHVPHGPRDLPMDIVITAEQVRRGPNRGPRHEFQNRHNT